MRSAGIIGMFTQPLPAHVWRMLAVRSIRSFTQAYLNVVAPLYLVTLGLSTGTLGVLFTASLLVGAGLLVPVGIFADRYRRKPFLLAFTILMVIWGALYATTRWVPILLAVSAVAGIGRGGGGMGAGQAGPFSPAEQALLADMVPPERRRDVFSLNIFLATVLAAAGAAFSGVPHWLVVFHLTVPHLRPDQLLFGFTAILGLVSLAILCHLPEPPHRKPKIAKGHVLSRQAGRVVWRQVVAGSINALGMGFVNPLFVLWLYLRFHVGAAAIGPVFAISFLVNGMGIFLASSIAKRIGSVRTIVVTRVASAVVTVATVFAPVFWVAAVLLIFRTALTMMVTPVRQAFTMNLLPPEERAAATGMVGLSRRVMASISPSVAGALMDEGNLALPFYLAGGLLLISSGLYYRFFGGVDERLQSEKAAARG